MQVASALAAVYLVWGSTYLAIRFAVETIPPFLMAGVRFLVSGLILYAWMRIKGVPAPSFRQWRSATVVGAFLLLGGNGLVVWAEQTVPSGLTSLLVSTVPIWMVLFDSFLPTGQRLSTGLIIGVLLGFFGVILLAFPAHLSHAVIDFKGVAQLLTASILWAVGSLYARRADLPKSPFLTTSMEMLCGSVLLLGFGFLTGEAGMLSWQAISTKSLLSLTYLTFFGSLIGFTAYIWLLHNTSVAVASTYAYINPLIAMILGSCIASERITTRMLVGTGLILVGVSIITIVQSRTKRSS